MNASMLVPDALWEAIEPLLPSEPPKPKGGRPRIPERAALGGIVFVLRTGCPWRLLPQELGCGSGVTCWRRLRDWQEAGVWQRLHERLLDWLGDAAAVAWSRASIDSLSVRAKKGVNKPDRTPPTEGSPVPSITSWWIVLVFHWQCFFQQLTPTTRLSSFHWLTPSHPSSAPKDDRVGLGSAQRNSTPTRPTIHRSCEAPFGLAASLHGLLAVGSTLVSGSVDTTGSLSDPSPGCSVAAALGFAMSGAPTCSKVCST
jgi:transposase